MSFNSDFTIGHMAHTLLVIVMYRVVCFGYGYVRDKYVDRQYRQELARSRHWMYHDFRKYDASVRCEEE